MALSCKGPGKEYCSQHFLTDMVTAFQGKLRYSGDIAEVELSLSSLKYSSFLTLVRSSRASTQQFNELQVIL